MSRPIDTAERRASVRASAEVSALKHLARAYGVTMRRRRRVGPVTFTIGLRDAPAMFGTLTFYDDATLRTADLFGLSWSQPSILDLAAALEFGPLGASAEGAAMETAPVEIILESLPDPETPITGLIPVISSTGVGVSVLTITGSIEIIPEPEPAAVVATIPSDQPRTVSIPVVMAATPLTPPASRRTIKDHQAAVAASLPSVWQVWRQFTLGVLLVLQLVAYVFLAAALGQGVNGILITMSVVAATVGIGITGNAIHTNDHRIDALRAVGLR